MRLSQFGRRRRNMEGLLRLSNRKAVMVIQTTWVCLGGKEVDGASTEHTHKTVPKLFSFCKIM